MSSPSTNLTGVWQGLYSDVDARPSVPFVAALLDAGGSFTGTTHEQAPEHGPTLLFGTLAGRREGRRVAFRKRYLTVPEDAYSEIDYEGRLNGEGTEIEGRWTIRNGNRLSGRFLMTRPPRAEIGVEEMVSAEV